MLVIIYSKLLILAVRQKDTKSYRDDTYRGVAPRVFRNTLWVFRHTH